MKFNIRMLIYPMFVSALVMAVVEQPNISKQTSAEQSGSDFNFVAAGDWGCKNDAMNTFTMMKKM
jgi:hypothetical protein